MIKLFTAAKAFIKFNGKILILKESSKYKDGTNFGKFDVVGGRLKPGEKVLDSLIREIKEETNLDVKIGKPFHVGEWFPKVNEEEWHVVGIFFECEANSDDVKISEDHESYEWINPKEYNKYNIIDNLKTAFEAYLEISKLLW